MSLSDTSVTIINNNNRRFQSKAKAWKYFRVKDQKAKLAICKICQNTFSYRTSVTNLLKHVRTKHQKGFSSDHQDTTDESDNAEEVHNFSLCESEECVDDNAEEQNVAKDGENGENETEKESVCLLCQMTFPDHNSDEMMKHMVEVHNISSLKLVEGSENGELEETKRLDMRKHKKNSQSWCWKYFTVTDAKMKSATCNLCDNDFSYNSTVSNLVKHIQRKHHIVHNLKQSSVSHGDAKNTYKPRSVVWSFYNYVNESKTVCACVHCQKEYEVADGLDNMKQHLLEEHPEALLHLKSNGDPLFITKKTDDNKGEETDDDNLQAEFLEFDDTEKIINNNSKKPTLKRKSNLKQKPSLEKRYSFERRSSVERRPSFSPRSSYEDRRYKSKRPYRSPERSQTESDSLDHFTNYIKSLLQELPANMSKKLQMNFVKQIIEAQISCAEAKNDNKSEVTTINGTVGAPMDTGASGIAEETIAVSISDTTTLTNSINSDGTVTMANGIILRPIVTMS